MSEPQLEPASTEEQLPLATGEDSGGQVQGEQIRMVSEPRGEIAEQFRNLRNSVIALNPDGASRTVVVTSAVAGEGKSVAVVNLAVALAELPGNEIVIAEANLHAPSIEGLFGLERRQGLADVLRGRCALDAAVRRTSVDNIAIIGAGSLPDNPSRLLGSDRTKVILNMLKQRYSYVLIDTPAALSISDASLLGAMVDGILLVVRLGSTPKLMVEQASVQLENMGGNLLGTCLTGGFE